MVPLYNQPRAEVTKLKYYYRSNLTYTNWHSRQPDNHQNKEACGEIYLGYAKWNGRVCSSTTNFVVEEQESES